MALGERFRSEFDDDRGSTIRVSIWQEGYAGSVVEVKMGSSPQITWEGTDTDVYTPIRPSVIDFDLLIENSTQEGIIADMSDAQEEEFLCIVLKDSVRYYAGIVLTDQIQYGNAAYPFPFGIRATDGLGRLAEIHYNQDGTDDGTEYSGDTRLLDHIINCLNHTGNQEAFNGTETFLKTAANFWEDSHVIGTGDDPWYLTRVNHLAFWETRERASGATEKSFMTCKDVLHQICLFQLATVYWSDGCYWIKQWDLHQDSTFEVREWRKAGASNGSSVVDPRVTVDQGGTLAGNNWLAGGTFHFMPPIRRACVTFKHDGLSNLTEGQSWSDDDASEYNAGSLDWNGGSAAIQITGTLWVESLLVGSGTIVTAEIAGEFSHKYVFHLKVQLGSYYLKSIPWSTSAIWSTDPTARVVIESDLTEMASDWSWTKEVLVTPAPLPVTGEELKITMDLDHIEDGDGGTLTLGSIIYTDPDGNTVTLGNNWEFQPVETLYLPDGFTAETEDAREYCVRNQEGGSTVASSIELDLGIVHFGDGPNPNNSGKMEVYDSGAASWSDSVLWQLDGSGTTYSLWSLVLARLVAVHLKSIRKYIGGGRIDVEPHQCLEYDSGRWVFLRGTYDLQSAIWSGSWFEYSYNPETELEVPDPIPLIPGPPPFAGPIVVPPGPTPGPPRSPGGSETLRLAAIATLTTGTTAGTFVERLEISALSVDAPLDEGQKIRVLDPVTEYTQVFELQRTAYNGDTFLEVSTICSQSFPAGATVNREAEDAGREITKTRENLGSIIEESPSTFPEGYAGVIEDMVLKSEDELGISGASAGFEITGDGIRWYAAGVGSGTLILDASDGSGAYPGSLTITGNITTSGDITYSGTLTDDTPDYVFKDEYILMPWASVMKYIRKHKHLPGIPSADELESREHQLQTEKGGLSMVKFSMKLLEKIEELYLYLNQFDERLKRLEDAPDSED